MADEAEKVNPSPGFLGGQEIPAEELPKPPDEGLTETEATNALDSLLSDSLVDEGEGEVEEPGAREEDDLPLEAETEEPEAEVEAEEETVEGDDFEEHAEDVDAEDAEGDSEADLTQTFTVKVDGEEEEVTLEEALDGYMRTAAFTRKTQDLAERRREVQEKVQDLRAEKQRYAEYLGTAETLLKRLQGEKPDPELRQSNPQQYAREMEAYEKRQEAIQTVAQERQEAVKAAQQEWYRQRQQRLEQEKELLQAHIPELVDEEKAQEIQEKMITVAQTTYGFTPEELGNAVDHRQVRLLHDAMKYQELKEKGEEVTRPKKAKKSKKTLKPGSSKASKTQSRSRPSEARKRLAKSGNVKDAAKYLESFF